MATDMLAAFPFALVRLNSECRLRSLRSLSSKERNLVRQCGGNAPILDILESRNMRATIKAIPADTAGLLRQLLAPRSIFEITKELQVPNGLDVIAALALDEVVEVEIDGKYRSGFSLARHLTVAPSSEPTNVLSQLSIRALDYCVASSFDGAMDLAWRLYNYNRLPVTPSKTMFWSQHEQIVQMVTNGKRERQQALQDQYECLPLRSGEAPWIIWRSKTVPHNRRSTCKLYVSPQPASMAELFPAVIDRLLAMGPAAFKIGNGAPGLMRPDKFVAYFHDTAQLAHDAWAGFPTVCAADVQGVPFSAQLDSHGMLSYGEDPLRSGHLPGHADDSWRIWVCNRLASAIVTALNDRASNVEAREFALLRMRLWGVDPQSWRLVK